MEALFHLSIPVDDLDRAKAFYIDALGCKAGRATRDRFEATRLASDEVRVRD